MNHRYDPESTQIKNVRERKAFALMSSLVLMAFIFLLLLNLSSFVQVESQANNTLVDVQTARKNALLGMRIALGELQKYAGPDQRVTARADILEDRDDINKLESDKTVKNPFYTLVWDVSGSEDISAGDQPEHDVDLVPAVLVSGNENYNLLGTSGDFKVSGSHPDGYIDQDKDLVDDQDSIWIVKNIADLESGESTNAANDVFEVGVRVKKQPVRGGSNTRIGNYAWWVGDEGVKAKVNLSNPFEANDSELPDELLEDGSYRWSTTHKADFSVLEPFFNELPMSLTNQDLMDSIADFDYNEVGVGIENISSLANLPLSLRSKSDVEGLRGIDQALFHDITSRSRGVLADVKHGGLKKDLSVYFRDGNNVRDFDDVDRIFEKQGSDPGEEPGSSRTGGSPSSPIWPCWGMLKNYVNFSKDESSKRDVIPMSEHTQLEDSIVLKNGTDVNIMPVMTRMQVSIVPQLVRPVRPPFRNRLNFLIQPQIVLWNPYSVDMDIANGLTFYFYPFHANTIPHTKGAGRYPPYHMYFLGAQPRDLRNGRQVLAGPTNDKSAIGLEVKLSKDTSTVPDPRFQRNLYAAFGPMHFHIDPVVIPAGRSMVFSLNGSGSSAFYQEWDPYYPTVSGSGRREHLLTPGWNKDAFFTFDTGIFLQLGTGMGRFELSGNGVNDSSGRPNLAREFANGHRGGNHFEMHKRTQSKDLSFNTLLSRVSTLFPHTDTSPHGRIDNFRALNRISQYRNNESNHIFIMSYSMRFSSENKGNYSTDFQGYSEPIRWLATTNPRSNWIGSLQFPTTLTDAKDSSTKYMSGSELYTGGIQCNSGGQYLDVPELPGGEPSWVPVGIEWDYQDDKNGEKAVIFDLPLSRDDVITNIAQLTHANILNSAYIPEGYDYGRSSIGGAVFPAFPLANSYASPFLKDSELFHYYNEVSGGSGIGGMLYDYSYYLNDAIYDKYFVSSIPLVDSPSELVLANTRMQEYPYAAANDVQEFLSEDGFEENAGRLLVNGAFNVNSTSEKAWASLLGGMKGATVGYLDEGSMVLEENIDEIPFPSLNTHGGERIDSGDLSYEGVLSGESLVGYRVLNNDQVAWLAKKIVEQVKLRGPFPSMSAFVNRMHYDGVVYRDDLDRSDVEAMKNSGALQAALDNREEAKEIDEEGSVNKPFFDRQPYEVTLNNMSNTEIYQNEKAGHGSTAAGVPGYLMQSDILSKLDNTMNVRSDTFVIRAYGDASAQGLTGAPVKARCEAVVQRLPIYSDSENNDPYDEVSSLNRTNETLGRKFQLVSFKWLSDSDI